MKCPYQIEPHQIQGLDFINIFPVVQWLVKRSVETRAEKSSKLKAFAIGQFHNHFRLESDRDAQQTYVRAVDGVRQAQHLYGPRRQYKRKDTGPDDEKTRVRITLLEYGNNGLFAPKLLGTPTSGPALVAKGKSADIFNQPGDDDDDDCPADADDAEMLANEVNTLRLHRG